MNLPVKPNCFIVGAAKCGTTALYEYLRRHPQVFMPENKEPRFFGRDLKMLSWRRPGLEQYLSLFREAESYPIVGEASVQYLLSRSAAAEIREFSPDARILIMVRDPVETMYSIHTQLTYEFSEDIRDFSAALEAEIDRAEGKRVPQYAGFQEQFLYRYRVGYAEQIERYIEQFGWERVHVVVYDDFTEDPNKEYQKVLAFLGAEPYSLPEYRRINVSKQRRFRWLYRGVNTLPKWYRCIDPEGRLVSQALRRGAMKAVRKIETKMNVTPYRRPPLPEGLQRSLRQEFAPEVERLGGLLGRDLSHWSRMPGER